MSAYLINMVGGLLPIGMQIMLRDRGFAELVEALRGKKVFVWTCNTCARVCGVGGTDNALELVPALRSAGIDVTGCGSAAASCSMPSAGKRKCPESDACDIVLALTCDVGSRVAGEIFGKPCLNPIITLGTGFLDSGRTPVLVGDPERTLPVLSAELSLPCGPFL